LAERAALVLVGRWRRRQRGRSRQAVSNAFSSGGPPGSVAVLARVAGENNGRHAVCRTGRTIGWPEPSCSS